MVLGSADSCCPVSSMQGASSAPFLFSLELRLMALLAVFPLVFEGLRLMIHVTVGNRRRKEECHRVCGKMPLQCTKGLFRQSTIVILDKSVCHQDNVLICIHRVYGEAPSRSNKDSFVLAHGMMMACFRGAKNFDAFIGCGKALLQRIDSIFRRA